MSIADSGIGKGGMLPVILLVAGTCIGGGMLALPVATCFAGFWPSLAMMFICFLFMAATGMLFVEANLWMEEGAHIITMSGRLLGSFGKVVSSILYLFIAYSSLVAYIAGGGGLTAMAASYGLQVEVAKWIGCLIFTFIFGLVIYLGNRFVGRVNELLFFGMIIAYVLLIGSGMSGVKLSYLDRSDWSQPFYSLPLLLTIFSYQAVVPSLTLYLGRNGKRLRISIICGVFLAFLFYVVWQGLVLGTVPLEGPKGLAEGLRYGTVATDALRFALENHWVAAVGEFFAFFAIVTSFFGMGLGLYDFLADGFKIRKKHYGSINITLLILIPSLFFALAYPRAFLEALDASGGFGDAILNGMIPVMMVWVGRYRKQMPTSNRLWGGRPMLMLIFAFALLVLIIEILQRFFNVIPLNEVV